MHGFLSDFNSKVEKATDEKHTGDGDDVSNEIFLLKVFTLLSILFGLTGKSVEAEEVRGKIYATDEESEGDSAEEEFFKKEKDNSRCKEVRINCFH